MKLKSAKTDADVFAIYAEFVSGFQDGHVGIRFPANSTGVSKYSVPVFLTSVEDRALIAFVGDDVKKTRLEVGDEVIAVDGVKTFDLLPIIKKYNAIGSVESDKHFIYKALSRDFYMSELVPQKNTVVIMAQKADVGFGR